MARSPLGPAIGNSHQALLDLDPTAHRPVTGARPTPDFTLLSVYRRKNAEHVCGLVEQAPASRLWGLDGVAPSLAEFTVGEGPGWRFPLLNRLADGVTSPYLVVSDDDVLLSRGSLPLLVTVAEAFGLDLCQPAHAANSFLNYMITMVHPFSTLRLTNFVEIGPLLVVGPRLRDQFVPFPDEDGMGWGTELDWLAAHEEQGARLAIVDAVNMKHLGRATVAYDAGENQVRLDARMRELGVSGWHDIPRTLETVRPWRAAQAMLAAQ